MLADKSEGKHMLSLMNVVISEREEKGRKRDQKYRDKHQYKEVAADDGPGLVESIFRPQPSAFKG